MEADHRRHAEIPRPAETTEFQLYADLEAGSRFEVRYYFHVVDAYDADTKRVRITTGSDTEGEWAGLTEVVSESDSAPSATSNLFQGNVGVSRNSDVKGEGDDKVWVPSGDTISVAYLNEDGVVKATSDTSPPPSPTPAVRPTPTNVPGLHGDPFPRPTATIVPGPPKREIVISFANAFPQRRDSRVSHNGQPSWHYEAVLGAMVRDCGRIAGKFGLGRCYWRPLP